jgi:hypothetical protein
MEGDYEENGGKLVWNFDDAESNLIFSMKLNFIKSRDEWNLENAYWALLTLLSEVEPLFEESIRTELNSEFAGITKKRKDTEKFSDRTLNEDEKGTCWKLLNDFYRKLSIEIVETDYYFRKKKQYLGL